MRNVYYPRLLLLLLLVAPLARAQDQEPMFPDLDRVLYQDAAHAYDDAEVIMLNRQRVPVLASRLIPVRQGDQIVLEANIHYTLEKTKTWQKVGAVAAGLAIGSLPYILENGSNAEKSSNTGLLQKLAPLAGTSVASLPFVLEKSRKKPVSGSRSASIGKNGILVPDAYMRYRLYDAQGKLLKSGHQTIDRQAKNAWQKLVLQEEISQDGYLQMELGNDSKRPVWIEAPQITMRSLPRTHEKPELGDIGVVHNVPDRCQDCYWTCVYTPAGSHCYRTCEDTNCYDSPPLPPPCTGNCGGGTPPGGGGSGGGSGGTPSNPGPVSPSDPVSYPGTIDYATATSSQLAVHLLKAIRYCVENGVSINLNNFFTNLKNHYRPGTHASFYTTVKIGGVSVPLYIEIPHHGPQSGLVFKSYPTKEGPTDGGNKYEIKYGNLGIGIYVQNASQASIVRSYLGYK